jgi:hypothetical protein
MNAEWDKCDSHPSAVSHLFWLILFLRYTTSVLPGCYPDDHLSKRRLYLCDTGLRNLNMKALPHFGTGQLVPG